MTVLCDTKILVDSMTEVLNQTRKNTCAGVRRVRGFGVVFTTPSLTMKSPLLVSETP